MNRRGFIEAFAAAATLDLDRLLWVPGKKSYFIPRSQPVIDLYSYSFEISEDPLKHIHSASIVLRADKNCLFKVISGGGTKIVRGTGEIQIVKIDQPSLVSDFYTGKAFARFIVKGC